MRSAGGKKRELQITPFLPLPHSEQPRFEHKHKNWKCGGGGGGVGWGDAEKEQVKTEPTPLFISLPWSLAQLRKRVEKFQLEGV